MQRFFRKVKMNPIESIVKKKSFWYNKDIHQRRVINKFSTFFISYPLTYSQFCG